MVSSERLRKYAELAVKTGANVQPGQMVIIRAELDQPEFVTMVQEECYKAGASYVLVQWSHQPSTVANMNGASVEALSVVYPWEEALLKYQTEHHPAMIHIISEDPDGLKGTDHAKRAQSQQARYKVIKPYREEMENKYQWTIVAVPGLAWARKVFPELSDIAAMEKLWDLILDISRVTDDPIAAWKLHNANTDSRCTYLNALGIRELHYTSANGTDLRVGMIPQAQFCGGGEDTLSGIYYNPNIPTEEVFITPKKGAAEGVVHSTMPLSYRGELIDGFWLRFEGGKVVEFHADKNENLLKTMLEMDEGASYLGECALVPYESPIRESGVLFYNTLFDENASCHLALGNGYTMTIKDFDKYTLEECRAMGVNDSIIHEDFMIGSRDMDIEAVCEDGRVVQIFKNGTWAF